MKNLIVVNTVFLSLANLLARAIGFFYFIFLARILGVEQFGHYSFAIALVYNFYPVADFGVERLILRDISKNAGRANEYFQKLIFLRVILSVLSVVLVTMTGLILSRNSADVINIVLFSLCLLPWTFIQLVAGIGNALEKMEVQSLAIILMSVLTAIFGGLAASLDGSVPVILLAALFANSLVAATMLKQMKRIDLKLSFDWDPVFIKFILKQSWTFALITIMAVFYLRATIVMTNFFKGSYFTGLYSSVFKFIEASILIPQSLALALFPQMARQLATDKKKLFKDYSFSLGSIFLMSLPFFIVFCFFPQILIRLAYGKEYLTAVPAAKILGLTFIPFFLNALPGNIIQSSNKLVRFLPFAFINLLAVFILGVYLIPRYSIEGAAWAVLIAEIFGFVINNAFVLKILNEKN